MEKPIFANEDRWLLPDGVDEVLPPRARRMESLRRRLIDLYSSWGYELIIPPFIEFLDSLLTGTGRDLDLQTFKVTDQLSGRMLGIRADMTPQAARIDGHQLKREEPVRLCYCGTVLHTRPQWLGHSRDPLQVGAELFGHAGIESDTEILSLMLQTLCVTGIQDLHVDVGHVGIFRGLARVAELSPELEQRLFEALQRKARVEIEALLTEAEITGDVRTMLAGLAELAGGQEVLAEARRVLANAPADVRAALDDLEALSAALRRRHPDVAVHFDLAELRSYQYQTGIVFAAFVPGHGQEVARGGRYDEIGKVFGRARPATGFSADLKTLVALSSTADVAPPADGVLAPWDDGPELLATVEALRAEGHRVIFALPGQTGGAREMGCDRVLRRAPDGQWRVEAA